MRFTAGCLSVVLGLVSACGSAPKAEPPALTSHLECTGSVTSSLVVDYDAGGRETRPPEQQAEDYAAAVGGPFSGKRTVAYRSLERIDIAFTDGEGRVKAVLEYGNHGLRGWWLTRGAGCA